MHTAKLTTAAMLPLLIIGCSGGDSGSGNFQGSGNSVPPPAATTDHIAMMVALAMPPGALTVTALADKGHAGGQVNGTPFTVSERNAAIANTYTFYTGESTTRWTTQVGGMNADGVLAGAAFLDSGRTFAWTWNGASISKLEPPAGYRVESVGGLSDDGRVAVNLRQGVAVPKAVIYSGGTPTDIPTLVPALDDGSRPYQVAWSVSGNGTVMGLTYVQRFQPEHIFTYSDGTLRDLGSTSDCNCTPVTVNNLGVVLATPRKIGAFGLLLNGVDRIVVPPPGSVNANVNVNDSNDRNDVVGSYWPVDGSGGRPFIFTNGQSYDLNDYTQAVRLGWTLTTAALINNNRQIVGTGTYRGQTRWYRLTLR